MMNNKKFALRFDSKKNFNAGSKATEDINVVLKKRGFEFIYIPVFKTELRIVNKVLNLIKYFRLFKIKHDSLVFVQHPQYVRSIYMDILKLIKRVKKCKIVFFVHDIESLRKAFPENNKQFQVLDNKMYELSDVIIAHNASMIRYLVEVCNVSKKKIIDLQLFDYLVSDINVRCQYEEGTVVVAGNLTEKKAGYVYKTADLMENLRVRAYGANYNKELNKNGKLFYEGMVKPEELPSKMKGAWGLVWDGSSVDCCEGSLGNYMRYNNPHKVSLYIASELPVIIWSEAALAQFVKKNNIGIVINSLKEVESKVNAVSYEEYLLMKDNIKSIADKIKKGEFADAAISLAEEKIRES